MADAAVSFAIQKLDDFLTQKINTRRGVKDGVRWLKDELGYLQSSVRAAEEKQEIDQLSRQWINNVKEVANDAVIMLERFGALQEDHEAQKQGGLDRLLWSPICMCKKEASLYDIGKKIKLLKGRVVDIKKRREEYGINNILATRMGQQGKRTILRATSFENLVDVVGFEDDYKTLLAELLKVDPSRKVISIHGMGGLGKTTLASKLYNSSKLSHFQSCVWVCVSQEYSIKDVLKTIIKSFMGHELDLLKMDEVDLLQHLRKLLLERDSYLVVIDDIWDIKAWEKIKKAFPDKNGGRVIITTRNKIIAQKVDDRCFVHPLRFLREDESWELFCKRAKPTRNLEKLGKEMVGKCQGLPLAIVVLSGLLLHKKSYEDWSQVKDHIWRHLKGDSVEIQEILSLSYNNLSFPMRQCFLYLARFPEDHTFEVHNLKLLWIAEEFISEADEGDGIVMEDVAEDYLNELINRNMIQIATFSWHGEVWECRVHDLVRDLAVQKAMEDKLLGIMDSSKQHPGPVHLLQGQPRHAIYSGIGKYLKLLVSGFDDLKLRSLAVIHNESGSFSKLEEMKLMYTRFKYLKVLDLTSVRSDGIPKEIGDLVLLKFLGLAGGYFTYKPLVVPRTIGRLKKLQTLCGSDICWYQIPTEMCELKELRHVIFGRGKLYIGSHQIKLQTLRTIWYEDWIKIDAVNLTNLRRLFIEGDAPTLESIANLTSLQTFFLKCFTTVLPSLEPLLFCQRLKSVFLCGQIKDPLDLSFLPNSVTHLTLVSSEFTQDPMPTLGSLSNLTTLDLHKEVYIGKKMVCSHGEFPSLQFLRLKDLPNLEEWQVEDGALSSLKGFEIHDCKKLKMVPQQVESVLPVPPMFRFYNLN